MSTCKCKFKTERYKAEIRGEKNIPGSKHAQLSVNKSSSQKSLKSPQVTWVNIINLVQNLQEHNFPFMLFQIQHALTRKVDNIKSSST